MVTALQTQHVHANGVADIAPIRGLTLALLVRVSFEGSTVAWGGEFQPP